MFERRLWPNTIAYLRHTLLSNSNFPSLQQISTWRNLGVGGTARVWCRQINVGRVETELYGQRRRAYISVML